jgi:hypothetical protein
LIENLLGKGFIENPNNAWIFENLIPKPYRRDHKPFQKRLERKTIAKSKTS